jgi:hypothetical protein
MGGSNNVDSMEEAKDSKGDPRMNMGEGEEDKGGGPRGVRGGGGEKGRGEKEGGEEVGDVRAGKDVRVREDGRGAERARVRVGTRWPGAVEKKKERRTKGKRERRAKMKGNKGKGGWRGGGRNQGGKRGVKKAKKGTGIDELRRGGPQEQMGGKGGGEGGNPSYLIKGKPMPKGGGKGRWRRRRREKRGWEGREEGEVREEGGTDSEAKREDGMRGEEKRRRDGIVGPQGSPNKFWDSSGRHRREEDQAEEIGKLGEEEGIDDSDTGRERDAKTPDLEGSRAGRLNWGLPNVWGREVRANCNPQDGGRGGDGGRRPTGRKDKTARRGRRDGAGDGGLGGTEFSPKGTFVYRSRGSEEGKGIRGGGEEGEIINVSSNTAGGNWGEGADKEVENKDEEVGGDGAPLSNARDHLQIGGGGSGKEK